MDVKFKASRDKFQHTRLILADARLGLSAMRADLVGLGHVVLEANLRQSIIIRLA
jgi:hypothetical protein